MTIADECLAEVGAHQDAWGSEHAADDLAAAESLPEDLSEAQLLRAAAQPVIWVVIKLAVKGLPGSDLQTDAEWAAMTARTRRQVLINRQAGIDGGLADIHLGLIDRVESSIGSWPETAWRTAVRGVVQGLVDAAGDGRRRGEQLAGEAVSSPHALISMPGWMLRHPTDHYFRMARARVTDPRVCGYLDQQITALAPNYRALAARDWSAEEARAGLVAELQIIDPVSSGWRDPVPARVLRVHRGSDAIGSQVGVRLVADPDATFNGKLLSVLSGERWRLCGAVLEDGTVLPSDGTRRLGAEAGL